mmetsp:Transcript_30475/g.78805  ORF Transcript_30475/g.78805 Transcript_30475/m.78805 type:complete len:235 (-) Transcript_30475:887-1591(-)
MPAPGSVTATSCCPSVQDALTCCSLQDTARLAMFVLDASSLAAAGPAQNARRPLHTCTRFSLRSRTNSSSMTITSLKCGRFDVSNPGNWISTCVNCCKKGMFRTNGRYNILWMSPSNGGQPFRHSRIVAWRSTWESVSHRYRSTRDSSRIRCSNEHRNCVKLNCTASRAPCTRCRRRTWSKLALTSLETTQATPAKASTFNVIAITISPLDSGTRFGGPPNPTIDENTIQNETT